MDRQLFHRVCVALVLGLAFHVGVGRCQAPPVAVSGIPLKDATNILNYYNNKKDLASIKGVLAGYGVRDPTKALQNPFLANVQILQDHSKVALATVTTGSAQGGGDSFNPFAASGVANALGSIIAERVRQDAEILAIQALSTEINRINADTTHYDHPLDKLLPLSSQYLEKIKPAAVDPSMWNVLQTDFRQDLPGVPNTLPKFFDSLNPPGTVLDFNRYVLHMSAAFGGQITVNAGNPYNIIDALAQQSGSFYAQQVANGKAVANAAATLSHLQKADAVFQALTVFSHALTVDRRYQWARPQDLKAYLTTPLDGGSQSDPVFLLVGLSYAADPTAYQTIAQALYPGQNATNAVASLASDLQTHLGKIDTFTDAAGQVLTQLSKLQADVKAVSDVTRKSVLSDVGPLILDFGGMATSVCDAINAAVKDTVPHADIVPQADIDAIKKWQGELYTLAQIATDARTGDYRGAISALIIEMPNVLPAETTDSNGAVQFIAKQGPLIASLASATNQQDFTAALDSYALPAGSFTQIQHESRSWTLNAYFGGELGAEILTGGLSGTNAHRVAPRLGLTAPVGFAYNWAKPTAIDDTSSKSFFQTGSQSVFFSVLDVGAVASFRLESGSGGRVASVQWSNIVAPGIYYVWTMKNTPLSVMVGTEYGPELRDISATGGNTLQRAVWQLPVVAFTFNIPLFQFWGSTASTSTAKH
jgi:hypothetical protein